MGCIYVPTPPQNPISNTCVEFSERRRGGKPFMRNGKDGEKRWERRNKRGKRGDDGGNFDYKQARNANKTGYKEKRVRNGNRGDRRQMRGSKYDHEDQKLDVSATAGLSNQALEKYQQECQICCEAIGKDNNLM
jgi:hypothetical protein